MKFKRYLNFITSATSNQQSVQNVKYKTFGKKAQTGEAVTWFVATIAIILILMFFTFGASYLAKAKSVLDFSESAFSKATYEGDDIYLRKTIYTQMEAEEKVRFNIRDYVNERSENGTGFDVDDKEMYIKIKENYNKK